MLIARTVRLLPDPDLWYGWEVVGLLGKKLAVGGVIAGDGGAAFAAGFVGGYLRGIEYALDGIERLRWWQERRRVDEALAVPEDERTEAQHNAIAYSQWGTAAGCAATGFFLGSR